jgi:phage I-like protein
MTARGIGQPIALNAEGAAPDWIMLIPAGAGGVLSTVDGRGPFRVADAAKLAIHSMAAAGGQILIDENHATDLAAPKGEPAPARGWIKELQARADGIWGRVEWSAAGAALMADRAYRFISPALLCDRADNVLALLRASLVNSPNLRGMAALHQQETSMDFLAKLRALLGLDEGADEAAVMAKLESMIKDKKGDGNGDVTAALNAALAPIAAAIGLGANADATAIVTTVKTLASSKVDGGVIVALQSELKDVTTQLNALRADKSKDAATAFVDAAIRDGVVGVKPLRDHYIARHAADPAGVEKEISSFPKLGASGTLQTAPAVSTDGKVSLNAEQLNAAKILGIKPDDYAKTLAAEQAG